MRARRDHEEVQVESNSVPKPIHEYVADKRVGASATELQGWLAHLSGGALIAYGPCPVCGHNTSAPIVSDVVANLAAGKPVVPQRGG